MSRAKIPVSVAPFCRVLRVSAPLSVSILHSFVYLLSFGSILPDFQMCVTRCKRIPQVWLEIRSANSFRKNLVISALSLKKSLRGTSHRNGRLLVRLRELHERVPKQAKTL